MIRSDVLINLPTSFQLAAVTLFAQSSNRSPVTDEQKIAEALRAGAKATEWQEMNGSD